MPPQNGGWVAEAQAQRGTKQPAARGRRPGAALLLLLLLLRVGALCASAAAAALAAAATPRRRAPFRFLLAADAIVAVYSALEAAAAAWEAQQRFVGRASHELKTPLASLTSALDVLDAHADQTVASQECWLFNMREDVDQMAGMACTLLGALDPGVDVDADVGVGSGADPAGSATSSATSPVTNGEEL